MVQLAAGVASSEHAVRRHLANVQRKLKFSFRAAAAAEGRAPGWFEPGPAGPFAVGG
jgi:DNA-binding CsgD family transcriptional regulator